MSKKLKDIVKINSQPPRPTFGVNPSDPWSAKSGLAESSLDQYLLSRGINPKFISKDTKISHAKSSLFLKWKQNHLRENDVVEVTEANKPSALERFRAASAQREKKHAEIETQMKARHAAGKDDMKGSIDRLEKSLNKEEVEQIDEVSLKTATSAYVKRMGDDGPNEKSSIAKAIKTMDYIAKKHGVRGVARATKTADDKYGINDPDHNPRKAYVKQVMQSVKKEEVDKKRQMSKSARMIKSLYKKHNVREDMHDWEKEDKSIKTYGKKPSVSKTDDKDHYGENKPDARAVMTGGKTLTGLKRDNIEIDPSMANRPDRPIEVIKDPNTKKQNN